MARKPIIHAVVIDGTLSTLDDIRQSNAGRLRSLLIEIAEREKIALQYLPGIQWCTYGNLLDVVAGRGLTRQVRQVYGGIAARYRPGDKVSLKVDRKGKTKAFEVVLNNRQGSTALVEKPKQKDALAMLGAEFETLSSDAARKLDIEGGVKVTRLSSGKLRKYTDMREGFIITKADGLPVRNVDELAKALEGKSGGVMLEGIYEDVPGVRYYAFGMQ